MPQNNKLCGIFIYRTKLMSDDVETRRQEYFIVFLFDKYFGKRREPQNLGFSSFISSF